MSKHVLKYCAKPRPKTTANCLEILFPFKPKILLCITQRLRKHKYFLKKKPPRLSVKRWFHHLSFPLHWNAETSPLISPRGHSFDLSVSKPALTVNNSSLAQNSETPNLTSDQSKKKLLHQRFSGWKHSQRINDYGNDAVSFAHLGYATGFDPRHVVDLAGSRRRMFITQPPTEDLEFFQATGNDSMDGDSDDDDEFLSGWHLMFITMAFLA